MIPVFRPSYGEEEIAALAEVLPTGWVGLGPRTAQFEEEFAAYTGAAHAVAVNSATAALHLATLVHDVAGGEVLVPSMTFVSTGLAPLYCGATPVFVDIDPGTLCSAPDDIARKLSPRTRAIMPVHFGGHPCDMEAIQALAAERGIPVLDDAAHACGAAYHGKRIGSLCEATRFSFHAVKNLAVGDGGMITLNDSRKAERLKRLRWVGIDKDTWKRTDKTSYSWY